MYDYMLEEMADAIARELHVDNNSVLSILSRYWQDKVAQVWQVDDLLERACKAGKAITRSDAADLLQTVFNHYDSDTGINWTFLDVELQEYQLAFNRLAVDKYDQVHGVFKVWAQGSLIATQFGLHPHRADGNFPKALEFAKELAGKTPGLPVFLGCEPRQGGRTQAWLSITLEEKDSKESEAVCAPCNPDNASAS